MRRFMVTLAAAGTAFSLGAAAAQAQLGIQHPGAAQSKSEAEEFKLDRLETGDVGKTEDKPFHKGEFSSASETEFMMNVKGKPHTHLFNDRTEFRINGKPAKLEDFRQRDQIRVQLDDDNTAIVVEAIRTDELPPYFAEREERAKRETGFRGIGELPPYFSERTTRDNAFRDIDQMPPNDHPVMLGVRIGQSPTTGVYVFNVMPDGPAEKGGIRPRDYIISINGQRIGSPSEFDDVLHTMTPGAEADVVVWRDEQRQNFKVTFAEPHAVGFRPEDEGHGQNDQTFADADQQQAQSRPWLGVMLSEEPAAEGAASRGVEVTSIYPSSPAARAGFRQGDFITHVGGNAVASADEISQFLAGRKPQEQVEFTVVRGGETVMIMTTLGSRADYGLDRTTNDSADDDSRRDFFGREGMGQGGEFSEHSMMLEQHRRFAEQHQRIEERLDALTQEVKQLREMLQNGQAKESTNLQFPQSSDSIPPSSNP